MVVVITTLSGLLALAAVNAESGGIVCADPIVAPNMRLPANALNPDNKIFRRMETPS